MTRHSVAILDQKKVLLTSDSLGKRSPASQLLVGASGGHLIVPLGVPIPLVHVDIVLHSGWQVGIVSWIKIKLVIRPSVSWAVIHVSPSGSRLWTSRTIVPWGHGDWSVQPIRTFESWPKNFKGCDKVFKPTLLLGMELPTSQKQCLDYFKWWEWFRK